MLFTHFKAFLRKAALLGACTLPICACEGVGLAALPDWGSAMNVECVYCERLDYERLRQIGDKNLVKVAFLHLKSISPHEAEEVNNGVALVAKKNNTWIVQFISKNIAALRNTPGVTMSVSGIEIIISDETLNVIGDRIAQ